MELRYVKATELRSSQDGQKIFGYASTFNTNAQLPQFQERVRPGAFSRSIRNKADVVCLFNHDANFPLGRTTAGTLRIMEDRKGLFYECDLPGTSYARDLHTLISNGTINGCSFAFKIPKGGEAWSQDRSEDGTYFIQRDLTDVDLLDVSPVTYPCYSGTAVDARTAAEVPAELRSRVEALNYGLKIGRPAGPAIITDFKLSLNSRAGKAFNVMAEAVRVYNKRHGTNYTEQQVQDALDRRDIKRRQKMLRDILND